MKLEQAIDSAKACGLRTYREAYYNIYHHVMNIFIYSEINAEMKELIEDLKPYMDKLDEEF